MKKINLLIPIAGKGSRFLDQGYVLPKQLLFAGKKQCMDWSLGSFNLDDFNLIFIIRDEHIYNFSYDKILKSKYGPEVTVVSLKEITRGSVESCLAAESWIDNDIPLTIFTMDVMFNPVVSKLTFDNQSDGALLTFKSNSPAYSYAQIEGELVTKTAEKEVISNNAIVGVYHFNKGSDFVRYAKIMIEMNLVTKGEFYLAPLYNLMIKDKKRIKVSTIEEMHLFGTPEELSFFENYSLRSRSFEPIGLCSDHSGFRLKEEVKSHLQKRGVEVIDFGTFNDSDCDYNDYIHLACNAFNEKKINKIFGFCRSGQGVNICASGYENIIPALIYNNESAKLALEHNAANFFSFPSSIWTSQSIIQTLDDIQNTFFLGSRHQTRIMKSINLKSK